MTKAAAAVGPVRRHAALMRGAGSGQRGYAVKAAPSGSAARPRAPPARKHARTSASAGASRKRRGDGAAAVPAAKKPKAATAPPPADDEGSEVSDEVPVQKHDKFFGGGYWWKDGTFMSTKAVKEARKLGATTWDEVKAKAGTIAAALMPAASRAGTAKAAAAATAGATKAASLPRLHRRPGRSKPSLIRPTKAQRKVAKSATSGARCSGKCRLARPRPTEKNKDGRGACGNVGCTNNGAVYGCKPCGIRLCSMECINAHMFDGRDMKKGMKHVEFHEWYTGE